MAISTNYNNFQKQGTPETRLYMHHLYTFNAAIYSIPSQNWEIFKIIGAVFILKGKEYSKFKDIITIMMKQTMLLRISNCIYPRIWVQNRRQSSRSNMLTCEPRHQQLGARIVCLHVLGPYKRTNPTSCAPWFP